MTHGEKNIKLFDAPLCAETQQEVRQ